MSRHSFEPEIAQRVGVNAAVIYQNLVWWCEKNAANERNIHEGRAWSYNSMKAFERLFPYLTPKQIRVALEKLEESGLIESGNFNKNCYDRTKWYCPTGRIDLPYMANGNAPEGEPIPDSKPDDKPDGKPLGDPSKKLPDLFSADLFEEFWNVYPFRAGKKKGKAAAKKSWMAAVKKTSPDDIISGARRYQDDRQARDGYAKDASTWLNQECWTDEIETGQRAGQRRSGVNQAADDLAAEFDRGAADEYGSAAGDPWDTARDITPDRHKAQDRSAQYDASLLPPPKH